MYTDEQLRNHIKEGYELHIRGTISFKAYSNGLTYLKQRYTDQKVNNILGYLILDTLKQKNSYTQQTPSFVYNQLYNNYSYKKYDDLILQIEYSPPETKGSTENIPQKGDTTMQGIDYVRTQRGRGAYTHMRAMLQQLWDIQSKHPAERFDIDSNFGYDSAAISTYLVHNASENEINEAHYRARASYKGRGRPQGARNRNTTTSTHTINDLPANVIDADNVSKQPSKQETTTKLPEGFDASKFVTHPQLDKKAAELRNDMDRIARNITDALQPEFERLEQKVNNIVLQQPTLVEIKPIDLPEIKLGVQHRCLPTLIKICAAQLRNGNRIIPWVYGPAGTGKSTAAEMVAKVLTPGRYFSLGKTLAKFEILGFINVAGYQRTEFREAYENGGTFCADEMDAWSPEATVALNGAIANGHCAFPDKTVPRHKDFIIIACANTTGAGATMDYVGRNKQDGATLDRFVSLYWPLDEALEASMIANQDWLTYVRHVRAKAASSGINPKPIVSPRASIHGEALLAAGLEWQTVVDICLRKGLSDAQWGMIS